MDINEQLTQFFESLEQQHRTELNCLPVEGYQTPQDLYNACFFWAELEKGPFRMNGYKECFWNIVENLKHEKSASLALAVFIKANPCSEVQLFLLLRLLIKTAMDNSVWDNRMETYQDRALAIFSSEAWQELFKEPQEVYRIGNVCQYNKHNICLVKPSLCTKQFLGEFPKSN